MPSVDSQRIRTMPRGIFPATGCQTLKLFQSQAKQLDIVFLSTHAVTHQVEFENKEHFLTRTTKHRTTVKTTEAKTFEKSLNHQCNESTNLFNNKHISCCYNILLHRLKNGHHSHAKAQNVQRTKEEQCPRSGPLPRRDSNGCFGRLRRNLCRWQEPWMSYISEGMSKTFRDSILEKGFPWGCDWINLNKQNQYEFHPLELNQDVNIFEGKMNGSS